MYIQPVSEYICVDYPWHWKPIIRQGHEILEHGKRLILKFIFHINHGPYDATFFAIYIFCIGLHFVFLTAKLQNMKITFSFSAMRGSHGREREHSFIFIFHKKMRFIWYLLYSKCLNPTQSHILHNLSQIFTIFLYPQIPENNSFLLCIWCAFLANVSLTGT